MPGCGRDGGFVTMILRLDHHLPRRPCTFSSWDEWFYSWMIAAALALWWGDLFDVEILCQRPIFAVVAIIGLVIACHGLYQYLPVADICHKALKLYHFPKSQIKSIKLEKSNSNQFGSKTWMFGENYKVGRMVVIREDFVRVLRPLSCQTVYFC